MTGFLVIKIDLACAQGISSLKPVDHLYWRDIDFILGSVGLSGSITTANRTERLGLAPLGMRAALECGYP